MSELKRTERRFEIEVNGEIVYADYRLDGKTLYTDFVKAPEALRGTGAAGKLMQQIKDYAKSEQLEIVPICGYAAVWLKRNA